MAAGHGDAGSGEKPRVEAQMEHDVPVSGSTDVRGPPAPRPVHSRPDVTSTTAPARETVVEPFIPPAASSPSSNPLSTPPSSSSSSPPLSQPIHPPSSPPSSLSFSPPSSSSLSPWFSPPSRSSSSPLSSPPLRQLVNPLPRWSLWRPNLLMIGPRLCKSVVQLALGRLQLQHMHAWRSQHWPQSKWPSLRMSRAPLEPVLAPLPRPQRLTLSSHSHLDVALASVQLPCHLMLVGMPGHPTGSDQGRARRRSLQLGRRINAQERRPRVRGRRGRGMQHEQEYNLIGRRRIV